MVLRDLEDLWLGPWRYLLLGACLDCECLDLIHKKLVHDLKSKSKMDVNESLLKIILGSARYSHGREQCFLQLYLNKGCYIGKVEFYDEKTRCKVFSNPCDRVEKKSALANQLISGAAEELEEEESVNRCFHGRTYQCYEHRRFIACLQLAASLPYLTEATTIKSRLE